MEPWKEKKALRFRNVSSKILVKVKNFYDDSFDSFLTFQKKMVVAGVEWRFVGHCASSHVVRLREG